MQSHVAIVSFPGSIHPHMGSQFRMHGLAYFQAYTQTIEMFQELGSCDTCKVYIVTFWDQSDH